MARNTVPTSPAADALDREADSIVAEATARAERLRAMARAMRQRGNGATTLTQDACVTLTAIDRAILTVLAASAIPVGQTDLEARAGYSRRTIGPRLEAMRLAHLTARPAGDRGGEIILPAGRSALAGASH